MAVAAAVVAGPRPRVRPALNRAVLVARVAAAAEEDSAALSRTFAVRSAS